MKIKLLIYCILCLFIFVSCENNSSDVTSSDDQFENVVLGEDLVRIGMPSKLDYLIENLVLSDEMIGILADADKMLFDAELLNPTENVKVYTTSKSKAINMGVYGAELNYVIHFSQTQYSMKYMLASKQLADQIGVAMAFNQQLISEYQTNVENKDSLINIIFTVYDNAKRMLQNEEQFMLSALVIVGSWVENMYITTTIFEQTNNTALKSKLITKVIEQKEYLKKLIEAVEVLDEGDNVFVTEIIQELKNVNDVYNNFGDRVLSESDVKLLQEKIATIRNKITKI